MNSPLNAMYQYITIRPNKDNNNEDNDNKHNSNEDNNNEDNNNIFWGQQYILRLTIDFGAYKIFCGQQNIL